MRRRLISALACSLALTTFSSCEPQEKTAVTPQAEAELEDIASMMQSVVNTEDLSDQDKKEYEEFQDLLSRYNETKDVNLTTKSAKFTLLHLAALYKKPELMRCLLEEGAKPNAQTVFMLDGEEQPGDTPLCWLMTDIQETGDPVSRQLRREMIDMLLAHGADPTKRGPYDLLPVDIASISLDDEEIILYLIDKMPVDELAPPITEEKRNGVLYAALARHHHLIVERLFSFGHRADSTYGEDKMPLIAIASQNLGDFEKKKKTQELLLSQGADINAQDGLGRTALFMLLTEVLDQTPDENKETKSIKHILYLLEKGARLDIMSSGDEERYPYTTCYDLLCEQPQLLEQVKKQGYALEAPLVELGDSDKELLFALCHICQNYGDTPLSHYAKDYDRIAAVIHSPSEQMLQEDIFADAVRAAFFLLDSLDHEKTKVLIQSLPNWVKSEKGSEEKEAYLLPLLDVLMNHAVYKLDSAQLVESAKVAASQKADRLAIKLIQLISNNDDSADFLPVLMEDENILLRQGAQYARLVEEGLPLPESNAVQRWLTAHNREADTEFLQSAVLLTSLFYFWNNGLEEDEMQQLITAIEHIGAQEAADYYRKALSLIANIEQYDESVLDEEEVYQINHVIKEAAARYFYENRASFFPAAP